MPPPPSASAYARLLDTRSEVERTRLFDCHLEAGARSESDLRNLAFFGVTDALVCLDDASESATLEGDTVLRRRLTNLVTRDADRVRRAGIAGHLAPGVAAAWVRRGDVTRSLALLAELVEEAGVVGIAGIGLGTGSPRERRALQTQLELASEHNLPVVICLQRSGQPATIRRVTRMAISAGLPTTTLCFAHANLYALQAARQIGATTILSVHPADREPQRLARFLRRHGADGVCLASMLDAAAGDVLALPRALRALDPALRHVAAPAFRANAMQFFGIREGW